MQEAQLDSQNTITLQRSKLLITLNCTAYPLTYPEVNQVCVHLSLCYHDLGDEVLQWSEQGKGSQTDGRCSLIACIFMNTQLHMFL